MSLPKKLLSFDIGNERTKIVYTQRSRNKITILDTIIIDTPPNAISDGALTDKEALVAVIKEALLLHKIKERNVVFSVASTKIITREVELPYVKPKNMDNIIRLNAEEYFPVNLAEYSLDYTVTEIVESEGAKKAKIIIFAALTSMMKEYADLADRLGLRIQSIDYAGNSIVSYVQNERLTGTSLFLDLGAESTMVTIMAGRVVKFSRNILFGTRLVNDSIRNHFEVSYEEATRISKERQLLSNEHTENTYLSNDVTSGMEQIMSGVSRLVDYYTSRNKQPVERIYLFGGGSEIHGIEDYVEQFFNLPTQRMNELKYTVQKDKSFNPDVQVYYASAIGAALSTINLLPAEIKFKEKKAAQQRMPYYLTALIVVMVGALIFSKQMDYNHYKSKAEEYRADITQLEEINTIIQTNDSLKALHTYRLDMVDKSHTPSDDGLSFINELEAGMPLKSFLNTVVINESGITLDVTTANEATVAHMLTYLKGIKQEDGDQPMFERVSTSAISRVGEESDEVTYVTVKIECVFTTQVMTESGESEGDVS